ncbi:recombinase family protein [Streptomyces tricolor]|uniref:Recombinase family protein n=1 Tax=Streptomyces tricolor TaxID=68277 RepID=A0ABS9JL07_9ACTN|nr:recombinase family protein [Streptomyces tricolor]MCG0066251.1 recombinase family protein [Streptomyces tricolor]
MPYAPEYLHLVIPGVQFEAYLYGRNSDDWIKSGDSVEVQLEVGRALCDKCGWRIVHEFNDTDVSASRHGKKTRDDFEALLDAIVSGGVQPGVRRIVVAYNAARYYRDLEAYVRLRNACLAVNALLCYNGQVYDLSKRDDLKATAQHAVDAEDEAEGIRAQNLRTAASQAEAGMPHGKSQYGYTRDYKVVGGRRRCVGQHEDERGKYVFQSIQRIDAGHSIRSVTRWLKSERQADRPDGVEWTNYIVRRMVLNRAYLGERQHLGVWRKASWAPIKGLDTPEGRAMFNRVTAELTDPARRTQRGTEVSHLLTYLAVCGECGDEPWLCFLPRQDRYRPSLTCQSKGDVSIIEEVLDAYVEEAVLSWFHNKTRARSALVQDEGTVRQDVEAAQRRINAYEEQLAEARQQAEEFDEATGRFKLSAASLGALEQRLLPKLELEQEKLQKMTGVSPLLLSLLDAADPESIWNGRPATATTPEVVGLSLEQKREVIRQVVTVRLYKASKRGSTRLDPNRIRLSFVGEPGFRARRRRGRGSGPAQKRGLPVGQASGT